MSDSDNQQQDLKTGYMCFVQMKKPVLDQMYPNLTNQELAKMICEEWVQIGQVGRQPYAEEELKMIQEQKRQQDQVHYQENGKLQDGQNFQQNNQVNSYEQSQNGNPSEKLDCNQDMEMEQQQQVNGHYQPNIIRNQESGEIEDQEQNHEGQQDETIKIDQELLNYGPFRLFVEQYHDQVRQAYPQSSQEQLFQLFQTQWNQLEQNQKDNYTQQYAQLEKQHNDQVKNEQICESPSQNNNQKTQNIAKSDQMNQIIPQALNGLNQLNSGVVVSNVSDRGKKESKQQLDARCLFSQQMQQAVKQSFPQIQIQDLTNIVMIAWRKLPQLYKDRFVNQAVRQNDESRQVKAMQESKYMQKKKLKEMGVLTNQVNGAANLSVPGLPNLAQINLPVTPTKSRTRQKKGLNTQIPGLQQATFNNGIMNPALNNGFQQYNPLQNPLLLPLQKKAPQQDELTKILQIYQQNQLLCSQLLMQAQIPSLYAMNPALSGLVGLANPLQAQTSNDLAKAQMQQLQKNQLQLQQIAANQLNPENLQFQRLLRSGEPTKADMLQYLTCWLCKGVYRDAHTINECMCTYCKGCVFKYYSDNPTRYKCPQCQSELGGKPLETVVKDQVLQNIVDSLIPDFKQRDDKLKSLLLKSLIEKRISKGTYIPRGRKPIVQQTDQIDPSEQPEISKDVTMTDETSQNSQTKEKEKKDKKEAMLNSPEMEFKLVPQHEDDELLRLPELPKKLKIAKKNKTILCVKRHINKLLGEAIDNIEILCKNFPVADSHSLEYIRRTKWQNNSKTIVLQYKRKKKITNNSRQEI
eukprot:403362268